MEPVRSQIPHAPGALHQLGVIRSPTRLPELFLDVAASGRGLQKKRKAASRAVVSHRAQCCQSPDEAAPLLLLDWDSGT